MAAQAVRDLKAAHDELTNYLREADFASDYATLLLAAPSPSLRSDAISFWPTRTRLCARPGREVPSDPRSAWRRLAVGVLCHPLFVRSFVRAERSVLQNQVAPRRARPGQVAPSIAPG